MTQKKTCILVSACILGENCKFNGKNNYSKEAVEFLSDKEVVPICPETLAGMPTPREPAEIVNGRVTEISGKDVHDQYSEGVSIAVDIISNQEIDYALLQSRSPTCGSNRIYDGSFSGKKIKGSGIFAQKLKDLGYVVKDVEDIKNN